MKVRESGRFLLLMGLLAACRPWSFFEFDVEAECWDMDPSPPRGVDLSLCRHSEDGITYVIAPDGNCWEIPFCAGIDGNWEGWRYAHPDIDAWCFDAAMRQGELLCESS